MGDVQKDVEIMIGNSEKNILVYIDSTELYMYYLVYIIYIYILHNVGTSVHWYICTPHALLRLL